MKQAKQNKNEKRSKASLRASVSFPPDVYEILEGIAKDKKVSVAWVVRDAVDKYVGEQWPLFEVRRERTR